MKHGEIRLRKIITKNQLAVTSLAIMIAVAGYLNFNGNQTAATGEEEQAEETLSAVDTMDISDGDALADGTASDEILPEEEDAIGDAVLTQAQVSEYVAGAKMEREQTRSKTKESLNEIIEKDAVSEEEKQDAVARLTVLAENIEKEAAAEQLLSTKGYGEAVVSIGDETTDVVLNYDELSDSDRAQIEDIVVRKTGCTVSQIVISRMSVEES